MRPCKLEAAHWILSVHLCLQVDRILTATTALFKLGTPKVPEHVMPRPTQLLDQHEQLFDAVRTLLASGNTRARIATPGEVEAEEQQLDDVDGLGEAYAALMVMAR